MDAAGREPVAIGGRDAGIEQDLVYEVRGQGVFGVGGGLARWKRCPRLCAGRSRRRRRGCGAR